MTFSKKKYHNIIHYVWLKIQHSQIDILEQKIKEKERDPKYQAILKCKDFQLFLVDFPNQYSCQSVCRSLESLSNISKLKKSDKHQKIT